MEDIVRNLLTRMENEWAPEALELGSQITFMNGVQGIIAGVVLLILASVSARLSWKSYLLKKKHGYMSDWEVPAFLCGVVSGITGIIATIILLDIWNWVAIFNPKLALAHDILNALLKNVGN